MKQRTIEIFVGFFVLIAIVALIILALKVSGFSTSRSSTSYQLTANFDNIGGLKKGAPVTVAGVKIGDVQSIILDPVSYQAIVVLDIDSASSKIPVDTSASILTAGILGAQYIGLSPGFSEQFLADKGKIQTTHSALVLENLIGQLIFNLKK